jgi:uncharacterized protein YndB with AHSA1/START domain
MPVKKDKSGRRYVEASVEVPGTPEDVWRAIATGPGVSSWFVPTEGEERVGGSMVSHFAPGSSMDSVAKVTAWEPPRRFEAVSDEQGAPKTATEWIVEAKKGGTCVVRVVHSWFAETDDWDGQFEGHEMGWPVFFTILRLNLTHFRNQPCSAFQLMGMHSGSTQEAWEKLSGPLGLSKLKQGATVKPSAGVPRLGGIAESVGPREYPGVILRLNEPAPGIVHLFALPMGGQVFMPVRMFFYGDRADVACKSEEPVWQKFMAEHFAPVS